MLSPSSAQRIDPPPSTTSTRPSPGPSARRRSSTLSSWDRTVEMRPENAGRPNDRNWTRQTRARSPCLSRISAVEDTARLYVQHLLDTHRRPRSRPAPPRPGGARLGRRRGLDLQRGGLPGDPGVRRISWVFTDPKNLPLEDVRTIRDHIKRSVELLVDELDRSETPA